MSFLDRSKEVAATVGAAARKQAKRAQLEVEARRIRSRINREYAAIGRALFPGLANGAPGSELPDVQVAVAEVKVLQQRLDEKTHAIDSLLNDDDSDVIDVEPGTPDDASRNSSGDSA